MNLLEVIGDLLEYPREWIKRKETIMNLVSESLSPNKYLIFEFLKSVSNYKELDLEEIYVSTFDNSDYTTLYMTYYITGEEKSRAKTPKRGFLLAWLKSRTKVNSNELPDYLPLLLKYLSNTEDEEVKKLIQEPMKILSDRLKEKNSVFYPLVLAAYLELYGGEDRR
ncbi:nitrate reductase molybdenum cofactor assembly chaperone [Sulfurisphaera ohwakuensis]|uniref:Nitrate reductase delta subunit n=1 Tax=Sulfurisphaera ohwakuensis TaxID=69656 RepID=A0A650CK69_SULOH|nr:nitrate reductase molybdenum cofactor assembly chaperone [Sulfurisphaera ohwakuensis]MBB5254306.1 nitrate reductase delta subunit [Sulfurisphaera ohwakuensis]QGR18199.1 nitrate reductase molybdenum cofactor assembly chaperone [Sulfurisphaera ohwakuensis]